MSVAIEQGMVRPLVPVAAPVAGVHRMNLPDLNELADWLVQRLQQRYPEATAAMILGWLRGCTTSNERWFVRTAHACALAELRREPLEPQPYAREIFCLALPEWESEALDLYSPMASWAAHQNASRLEVETYSDVSRASIATRLGIEMRALRAMRYPFIALGRLD